MRCLPLLEAAECGYCGTCGCALVVRRSPRLKKGSLAKEVDGRKFPTLLPSQKHLLMLLREWCLLSRRPPDANKVLVGV